MHSTGAFCVRTNSPIFNLRCVSQDRCFTSVRARLCTPDDHTCSQCRAFFPLLSIPRCNNSPRLQDTNKPGVRTSLLYRLPLFFSLFRLRLRQACFRYEQRIRLRHRSRRCLFVVLPSASLHRGCYPTETQTAISTIQQI